MPHSSYLLRIATLGVLVAAFLLAGCGRKGALDPPPGASMQPASAEVQPGTGDTPLEPSVQSGQFGQDGRPLATRGTKKKLPADVLID